MSINNISGGVPNIGSAKSTGKIAAYNKIASQNQQVVLRAKSAPTDEIRISGHAIAQKEIADEAKKITAELTADRSDYINTLKEQFANGTYSVPSGDLANSFLNRVV
jgi:anti-sigma28 factor (negative regulator of flagellin synthesis)